MQKRGFTLAEILISVGIVGVIAAIMLPMVNKFKPDENKIKFLQTYNSLVEIMPSIVNNRLAYPIINEGKLDIYDKSPLLNTESPFVIDGETFKGAKKFCRLLATGFNTVGNINCSGEYKTLEEVMSSPSFTTANGVEFYVQTQLESGKYSSEIYLDVNGADGENCFSNVDTCKDPDRFMLKVGADGTIEVADSRGQQHLETRTNWKKNRDLEVEVANLDTSTMEAETETMPEDNSKGDTVTPPTIGDGNGGDGTLPDITPPPPPPPEDDDEEEEEITIELPPGLIIAEPQPDPARLRKTYQKGVYCRCSNDPKVYDNLKPGQTLYGNLTHYYYSKELGLWIELDGVYYASGDSPYDLYDGPDAGDVKDYYNVGW